MTPTTLEIRAAAYLLSALLLIGFGIKLGVHHVQAQWNIDKLAQSQALSKAQSDLTAALADRVQLQQQVAKQNDNLKAKSDVLVNSITDSVRSVQAALRAGGLFAAMANSGTGVGAGAVAGSNSALERAFTDVGDSIREVTATCLHDAREITVIQAAAPKSPH